MLFAITATEMALGPKAPIVFRGSYEETLPQIAGLGYDGVEAHIHDSVDFDRARLQRLLAANHLTLTAIGTGTAYGRDGLTLTHDDAAMREAAVQRLNGHLETAAGHPGAAVIVGLIRGKAEQCTGGYPVFEQRLLESLARCAAHAKRTGGLLVLEMVNRYEADALNSIEEGLAFLQKLGCPEVKLHLDTYHMNIEETDIPAALATAGDAIGYVHLSDNDRWYPGHGHYPFGPTVEALQGIGYKGGISVESRPLPDGPTAAHQAAAHILPLLSR